MNNAKVIVIFAIVAIAAFAGLYFYEKTPQSNANLDSFAQCLAQKEVTMYGAVWCSFCKKQKADFGDSFKYVKYVECPDNTKLCAEKGINGYPTWIFPDGKKLEGLQDLQTLSSASGCELPK